MHTLADFAALPGGDVLARFGFDAAYAHRLASGEDERPLAVRKPPPDLDVTGEYDPPLERVDMAAFAAKALAERLHERLAGHGLAATRLGIEAHTEAGEELHRVWRHDGLLDAAALADRVRWQLDGWLTGTATLIRSGVPSRGAEAELGSTTLIRSGVPSRGAEAESGSSATSRLPTRPTAGIDRLRLIPEGVVRHAGMQAGLWGEVGVADEQAHRALVRVQGLLGPDSVFTAVLGGGRGYADRVRLVPWGDERTPGRPGAEQTTPAKTNADTMSNTNTVSKTNAKGKAPLPPPWPGQLPAPAPATVLTEPGALVVRTADGAPLTVDARLVMSGVPGSVQIGRGVLNGPSGGTGGGRTDTWEAPVQVTGWAGPWPVQERWWAPVEANRLVRLQLTLDDGRALLVTLREGQWAIEAIYD
jgi:protein ImuB